MAKRKERLSKFCISVRFFLFPCLKFFFFLSPCLVLALIPTPVFCLKSFAILSFCCVPAPVASATCLVMLLFFVTEFQLFYCHFFWLVHLFFLDLHLSKYLNNFSQMSLGLACQPALQSTFVYFWLLACIIQMITTICII